MKVLVTASLLIFLTACQQAPVKTQSSPEKAKTPIIGNPKLKEMLHQAEDNATPAGKQILVTGKSMALFERKIVKGSCWDYANAIYNQAGYPNKNKKRKIIYKGKKGQAFTKSLDLIQSGDFLYYINHSYHGVEHSAIFIDWINKEKKTALMLSYAGQNRKKPARYKVYDLSHVYHIMRPIGKPLLTQVSKFEKQGFIVDF